MARAKKIRTYKQTTVNAVILVVVLALCVYMAIHLLSGLSPKVSTQRTQKIADSSYAYLEGYVFRSEDRVTAPSNAIVDYLVRDGERVGVGHTYAALYSSTGLDAAERRQKESQLRSLSDRIYLIENGLKQSSTSADLSAISREISAHYYSYINSVSGGDIDAADKNGQKLLASIVEYSVSAGGDSAKNVISELTAQKQAISSSLGTKNTVTSDQSFNFLYSSDGYENIFSSDKLANMTPNDLLALVKSQPESESRRVIGRRVYTPKWYLAIPVDEATYLTFTSGKVYDVTFSDSDGVTIDMTLERICIDEVDENNAYMLFSSYDLETAARFSRTQSVRIYLDSCSGYRVPKQAVYDGAEYDFVYVLVGNTVELRRISIKGEGTGYYIVSTFEEDYADNVSSDVPYLKLNDMLITSGNDLYDGKHLD